MPKLVIVTSYVTLFDIQVTELTNMTIALLQAKTWQVRQTFTCDSCDSNLDLIIINIIIITTFTQYRK